MAKLAFMFPGQASQHAGMGRQLAARYPEARAVFDEADRALGFPISELCFNGPEEQLNLTENTQPAVLTASLAAFRVLQSFGVMPDYVAGHSLGEYSAIVAAGGLSFADAARIVRKRGQYMQEAVAVGVGAMAAVTRMPLAGLEQVCREASGVVRDLGSERGEVVAPANINSPDQIVISGHRGAVARAVELARQRGAKRAITLPVSAPFHCQLMTPAQERLRADLEKAEFRQLSVPLVNNVDARQVRTAAEVRDGLVRQVSAPVQWERSVRRLLAQGVEVFVEVGPGKVLSGLLRQIEPAAKALQAQDEKSVSDTLEQLADGRRRSAS